MIWALHGNLGSPTDWNGLRSELPDLEAVDLWKSPPTAFEPWASEFNHLVREADPDPILLGYSLGGRLAMHCATASGSPWKAAIFVSAHPGLRSDEEKEARLANDREWAQKLRTEGAERFLEAWNQQPVFDADEVPEQQLHVVNRNEVAIAQAFETWSLGLQKDQRPRLAESRLPQLWVAGEHDPKFRDLAEQAVSQNSGATLTVIPEAGHRAVHQRPNALASVIRQFMAKL